MTKSIVDIAATLGIGVHDHIIVGKNGNASLKGLKLRCRLWSRTDSIADIAVSTQWHLAAVLAHPLSAVLPDISQVSLIMSARSWQRPCRMWLVIP